MKSWLRGMMVVTLLLASGISQGAGTTTFGAVDCGKWISLQSGSNQTWLLGFLTGINLMWRDSPQSSDPLGKLTSAEQIFVWMDNYCKANPLKSVSNGATILFNELVIMK